MDDNKKKYIELRDLEVYQLARELSRIGWRIYTRLSWQDKKIFGDQFIEATDSFGANIAEGYGRYHYLDRIKFFYNARASFMECNDHWVELIKEREKISKLDYKEFKDIANKASLKIQNFISAIYKIKNTSTQ